jgi:DNA helicase-2/ATP-dependent DNA helicase PcrA
MDGLNPAQRRAVEHGMAGGADVAGPLLIIAGAGSGKTTTLAHRVARLILGGADPRRILMLTFTRRAAAEMTRRAERIVAASLARAADAGGAESARRRSATRIEWSGTFHAVANRLLRYNADAIGLDPSFTVLDRSDSADLIDVLRNELGLAKKSRRFPKKVTCLSIYSHAVNAQRPVEDTLRSAFPWCESWADELKPLFAAYVKAKQERNVLDYDDLLLYWYHMMAEPELARAVGDRFEHVLVDEYQDTNALQAAVLLAMKPQGRGVTVVGDDAQSIYSFRAATVRNILDFPCQFDPPAAVVKLEQNYRSTEPILEACNAVIGLATERFTKNLRTSRASCQKPLLMTVEDEASQAEYVAESVLDNREAGISLKRQAVLFRTSHHSDQLEVELARRDIPFVKFGGLKFLEAAHVKDMICVLRWAENPRDSIAAFRVLQLLPGIGPASARGAIDHLQSCGFDLARLGEFRPPSAAATDWPALCELVARLRDASTDWHAQVGMVRHWYDPYLERLYDSAPTRAGDLEQLEQIAAGFASRERFLTDVTLDPPSASGDEAGEPLLDEDYLILSTIHSAKGQEWDVVHVLNVVDGCIPSDMATGTPEQVEEERRLLYVAMTRARDELRLVHPLRFYTRQQHRFGDNHVYSPRTRFIPESIVDCFERRAYGCAELDRDGSPIVGRPATARVDVAARLRDMWQ